MQCIAIFSHCYLRSTIVNIIIKRKVEVDKGRFVFVSFLFYQFGSNNAHLLVRVNFLFKVLFERNVDSMFESIARIDSFC